MFVITTRLNKRKLLWGAVIALAVIALAVALIAARGGDVDAETSLTAVVRTEAERVGYLESFGWKVGKRVEEQPITIPREFNEVYSDYNDIQREQGFDLAQYGGLSATRYTYTVENYPGVPDGVVSDIIVYRNQVIAGDVQCVKADGFMRGLKFPEKK